MNSCCTLIYDGRLVADVTSTSAPSGIALSTGGERLKYHALAELP